MADGRSVSVEWQEADQWLADETERLAGLSWDDLAGLAGTTKRRPLESINGRSLDLETQLMWDDDPERRHLLVTVEVWDAGTDQGNSTEVGHDEFVLSSDGHGGVVGPVRRMEVVPGSRASRYARGRVIAPGRRFGPYDIAGVIIGIALAWGLAANAHFSGAWVVFAGLMTAGFLIGFGRRLFRR
jgi:hypothetical protein